MAEKRQMGSSWSNLKLNLHNALYEITDKDVRIQK